VAGGDPVKLGLVASFSRPGGNLTGVSLYIVELGAKRLELLRELIPNATSVAVLANPNYPTALAEARDLQALAISPNLKVDLFNAVSEKDLEPAFAAISAQKFAAVLVANDPVFVDLRDALVRTAARYAVPTLYISRDFVEAGGLISYGADIKDGYRKAGIYTGQILNGAKPAELPVLQPSKFELVVNLQTAKVLGLTLPPTLLARADEVIE
jgi:putative ABC transport system substrate-binding protein